MMIMDNKNTLTSYAFLAALNENGTDLYNAVYLPLCKRALTIHTKENTHGTDNDIKKIIQSEFGVDMPILVVQRLIVAIANGMSRRQKEKTDFKFFSNGQSFQCNSYVFSDFEQSYESERRQANALQEAFETFVKTQEDESGEEMLSFASFIDLYKNDLSSFLLGKVKSINVEVNSSFMNHVRFLQYIETNNNALYKVAERIFMGSIIASYIESEMDVNAKPENKVTYFLDSKIVLEALDLQNAEDTQPTRELLNLIRDTGGTIKVLDVTLNEIQSIIDSAIDSYNKHNPTTTVNEACVRINQNKTWLTKINGNLGNYLVDTLKVEITKLSENDIKDFTNSEDTNQLQKIWYRKNTAAHDVIAYLYVRKMRKANSVSAFIQKASYWFITANKRLCDFNISRKENGFPQETILPQELTSLLFLQNPKKYGERVSTIGLNELMAQTLSDEYPSRDILNEFDSAIRDNSDISEDDYKIVLSAVSQQSTNQLQKLLEESLSSKDGFNSKIHQIIAKERNRRNIEKEEREKTIRDFTQSAKEKTELIGKNKELEEKLAALSQQIAEIQKSSEKQEEKYKALTRENANLKLKKWKRPKYWLFCVILVVCLIALLCCFVFTESHYNIIFRLIEWIDSLEGVRNNLATTLFTGIFGAIAIISGKAIFTIKKIQSEEEEKNWFKQVLCEWFNKK